MDTQEQAIIFVHVPKTAGTTLNRIIDREYNPLRIFSINGRYFRSDYRRLIHCPSSRLRNMVLFRGHMPFGLHRFLHRPATYITVLRDPVERTISEYFFAVNRKVHREHRVISQLSLEQFVRSSPYNNAQTKLISGQNQSYDFLAGNCGAETLDLAKDNLARCFTFIGITERFKESLALAKMLMGWKINRYAKFRTTPRRPKTELIDPAARELIAEYNQYDLELYRYASELFDEMLRKHSERMSEEMQAIQRAEIVDRLKLLYFRRICGGIKMLNLMNSAMRSFSMTLDA